MVQLLCASLPMWQLHSCIKKIFKNHVTIFFIASSTTYHGSILVLSKIYVWKKAISSIIWTFHKDSWIYHPVIFLSEIEEICLDQSFYFSLEHRSMPVTTSSGHHCTMHAMPVSLTSCSTSLTMGERSMPQLWMVVLHLQEP